MLSWMFGLSGFSVWYMCVCDAGVNNGEY